jgi:RHS repeat-associated protein
VDVTSPNIPTAQNGPGVRDVNSSFFDTLGRVTGTTDADGFKTSTTYDDGTSAVTQTIQDSATGGLNLKTQMTVDSLGRTTTLVDPNNNTTYTVYDDPDHEVRTYVGWNSTSLMPTLPTQVTRQDWVNNYDETLTMTAPLTGYLTMNNTPNGMEPISNLQSLSRTLLDNGSRVIETDSYFNLPAYSSTAHIGTLNTNYYAGYTGYDAMSNTNHSQDDTGTIDDTLFDGLDRPIQVSEGTNDTTNNNMLPTDVMQYDGGGVGDGDLTNDTEDTGGSAPNRVDQKFYDWRDRVVAEKQGVQGQGNESSTVHRQIILTTLDNLNEATQVQSYDGDGVTVMVINGVVQPLAPGSLRKQTVNNFDEQGRIYQSIVYDVNQTTGAVGNPLTTNFYFNHRGLLIEQVDPGGLVTKTTYDGVGRPSIVYKTDGGSGTGWFQASNVSNDNVLLQTTTSYDNDGQVTLVQTKQRFDSETGLGGLGNATTAPLARVSYVANYYDRAERQVAAVDFGTNGALTFTRPSTVPARSDTVLVTAKVYTPAGWVQDVYDPRNLDTRTFYDGLGRSTSVVQDYTNGVVTDGSNRTTNYTYDGSNHVLTVTAVLTGTAVQTTQYSYGVSPANGSSITSNDLLNTVAYPDPALGTPSASLIETYKYNELNQATQMTDRNGNVHSYTFDVLGRQTGDAVTPGSGVDNHVQEIDTAYNDLNLPFQSTSLATPGGSVVNQVQLTYNGFGQLTSDQQAHSGTVGSGTPKVVYLYVDGAGANNSRQVSMTYPGLRVISDSYGTTGGLNDTISRLSAVLDGSTTLESYKYLGLGTVVERDHPTPLVNLTYINTGTGTGDAGDKYTGLDRFGRVVEQNWYSTFSHASRDDFLYLYDRDNNALYEQNTLDLALSELYHKSGSGNGYDVFNQISAFLVGTLSASGGAGTPLDTVATPSTNETWSLDVLGNWKSQTVNGTQTSRTTNLQNEQTVVGTANLTYDKNGNTTVDNLGHTLVYDAWNRLVAVKNGGTTLAAYAFDGMGRRIQEAVGSTTLDLYFAQDGNIIEQDVSGAVQATYVWNPLGTNSLIERDRGAERLYVEQDANGNVTSLVNTSGTVVERYRYDAYGNVTYMNASWGTISASAYAAVYLFQGGRLDPNTGNYIFQARDYSPSLGHWLEQDPAGYGAGSLDLYGTEGDNPVNRTDSSGLDWRSWLYEGAAIVSDTAAYGGKTMLGAVGIQRDFSPRSNFYQGPAGTLASAASEGVAEGAQNEVRGAGNALYQAAATVTDVAASGGKRILNGIAYVAGSDNRVDFSGSSQLYQGYEQAKDKQAYVASAGAQILLSTISLGTWNIGQAIGDFIATGDATRASQMLGGVAAGNLTAAGIGKATGLAGVTVDEAAARTASSLGRFLSDESGALNYSGLGNSIERLIQRIKTMEAMPVDPDAAAADLGYGRTNYVSHGQRVYYSRDTGRYISPDVDSHIGGVWKMAESVEGLASKNTRLGTYDANLNRIGD